MKNRDDGHAAEVLIFNGYVLTMDAGGRTFPRGYVRIRGDSIVEVGPWDGDSDGLPSSGEDGIRTIDARGGIIMPGMVNGHSHIGMSLFRSMADDTADRLRKVIFPLEDRCVTPDLVYAASMHSLVEMIQGGVTCFTDMYYFEDRVAEAADLAGLRCILGETVIGHPAPDARNGYGGLDIAEAFIDRYRTHPLITPAAAPHATYSLNEEAMVSCGELSERTDTPLLLHVAEMPFEMEQFSRTDDRTPVAWLDRLGLLTPRLIAAHCIYVDEDDMNRLVSGDCGVVHNIVANIKSAKGIAPVPRMMEMGMRVGLGTDGPMSGNTLDIVNQLGYVAKIHKYQNSDATAMPARAVVELATMGGARALHLDHRIGSLEPGKRADIAVISIDAPSMFPLHDPWSALVYGASPRDVSTVLVDGRILMEDRVIPHLDIQDIRNDAAGFSRGLSDALRDV